MGDRGTTAPHGWPGCYSPSWVTRVLQCLMGAHGWLGYYSPSWVTRVLQPLIGDRGTTAPHQWPGYYSPLWVTGVLQPLLGDRDTTSPHRWPLYYSRSWVTGVLQLLIGDRGPHALIGKVLAYYDIIMHQIAFNIGHQAVKPYIVGFDHGLPCRVKNMARGTQ